MIGTISQALYINGHAWPSHLKDTFLGHSEFFGFFNIESGQAMTAESLNNVIQVPLMLSPEPTNHPYRRLVMPFAAAMLALSGCAADTQNTTISSPESTPSVSSSNDPSMEASPVEQDETEGSTDCTMSLAELRDYIEDESDETLDQIVRTTCVRHYAEDLGIQADDIPSFDFGEQRVDSIERGQQIVDDHAKLIKVLNRVYETDPIAAQTIASGAISWVFTGKGAVVSSMYYYYLTQGLRKGAVLTEMPSDWRVNTYEETRDGKVYLTMDVISDGAGAWLEAQRVAYEDDGKTYNAMLIIGFGKV